MPRTRIVFVFAVLALMAYGAPTQAHDDQCQELHAASFMDDPDVVQHLIEEGADINCLDVLGQTPLITAVNGASIDSFFVLLDNGAQVNVKTEFGNTLLQHTKAKHASFKNPNARVFRNLYARMVAQLVIAGAVN